MHRRPAREHPWERYGPLSAGYAEAPEGAGWDSDGDSEPDISAAEAGDEFSSLLINLRLKGVLSATQCCTLAYWAEKAGATGPVSKFAMKPGQKGGLCQRKLDAYLRVAEDAPLYIVPVPGHDRGTAERVVHELEAMPPHEAIAAEIAAKPDLRKELRETPAGTWGPGYEKHPLVRASPPGTVFPLALYLDGVPYTRTDGFLGIWIIPC